MDTSLVSKEKLKCKHCGGKTHNEEHCFKKYPHLLKEFRAKRAASQKGTAATTPPVTSSVVSPSTTPAAPQSSTPVSAYMSSGSLASTLASGSTHQSSSWY
uniref:Uncharacterized protein n=1 Tax=Arundo donax TaxID=35708 RepID=A0A0A9GVT5_ARUDO